MTGLMAAFFLLVGLEIKREAPDGQFPTWSRLALPGFAALGTMVVPALIFLAFNRSAPAAGGWACCRCWATGCRPRGASSWRR